MIKKNYIKKSKVKKIRKFTNLFKNNKYFLSKKYNWSLHKEKIHYIINVKITPNNVFCCLKRNSLIPKTIVLLSAGILKLNITKKKLKFASKYVLQKFLKNLRNIRKKYISIEIIGPVKIKKNITNQILSALKNNKLLIKIRENKSFNGCRPKKLKRKKRKGFRILK